jgi:hypothetical protein
MMGRAVSDDNAEQPDQLKFSRRPHPQSAAFSVSGLLFHSREFDMPNAAHPFDALMISTRAPPAVFVRGEGSLRGMASAALSRFRSGWAVNCLGHSPPKIAEALTAQAKLSRTPSLAFTTPPASSWQRRWSTRVARSGVLHQFRRRSQ